jgi:hypothetical protein
LGGVCIGILIGEVFGTQVVTRIPYNSEQFEAQQKLDQAQLDKLKLY